MIRRPTLIGTVRWIICALGNHAPCNPDLETDVYHCACGSRKYTGEELVNDGYDPFDRYLGASL